MTERKEHWILFASLSASTKFKENITALDHTMNGIWMNETCVLCETRTTLFACHPSCFTYLNWFTYVSFHGILFYVLFCFSLFSFTLPQSALHVATSAYTVVIHCQKTSGVRRINKEKTFLLISDMHDCGTLSCHLDFCATLLQSNRILEAA